MNTTFHTATEAHPTLAPLFTGSELKVFEVTGKAGMVMPRHHSTHEAVLTVKSGYAHLIFDDSDHFLTAGTTFLISAGKPHVLEILEDFKAEVVMLLDSEIKFDF